MLDVPAGKGLGISLVFSSSTAADGGGPSRFCLFCIFSINDRFRASNRLRKIDEFVLNLMHLERHVTSPRRVYTHFITHRRVISDFQNQLSFRRPPLYTIPRLHVPISELENNPSGWNSPYPEILYTTPLPHPGTLARNGCRPLLIEGTLVISFAVKSRPDPGRVSTFLTSSGTIVIKYPLFFASPGSWQRPR